MTIATDAPATMTAPSLDAADAAGATQPAGGTECVTWRIPTAGLWVAETPSAYLGMVDHSRDGFVATSSTGRDLGVFATLADAQLAVYRTWSTPDAAPRAGWTFRGSAAH
ncbi:hypothetical protein [Leifsonia sp. NCR5]|uniref:hypothetical protein n=1 Tax=Leifsonia sp. NCR5 TaxID=1978342 RepID=UPI0015C4A573|nr:hypothetical protein [Leifsonia sp. NCR5]